MTDLPNCVRIDALADRIALITIDNPPVNALSAPLRRRLRQAIEAVIADPQYTAGVICGTGRAFIAGADLSELDRPALPDGTTAIVTDALDASPKPFVAAIHGAAMGGGFEIALACHARVMSPNATVGLPESRIGLVPAAGGTQRLPRLAGLEAAIRMVASGRHVSANEALRLGLADEIDSNPRDAAKRIATVLVGQNSLPRLRDLAVEPVDPKYLRAILERVRVGAKDEIAPLAAAKLVACSCQLPFDDGLAEERRVFASLRNGPQSEALRYIFRAERIASRSPVSPGAVTTAVLEGQAEDIERLSANLSKKPYIVFAEERHPVAGRRHLRIGRPAASAADIPHLVRVAMCVDGEKTRVLLVDSKDTCAESVSFVMECTREVGLLPIQVQGLDFLPRISLSGLASDVAASRSPVATACLVNAAASLLDQGYVYRASDLDVLLVRGFDYPAWRGGPFFEADQAGLGKIMERLEESGAQAAATLRESVRHGHAISEWKMT